MHCVLRSSGLPSSWEPWSWSISTLAGTIFSAQGAWTAVDFVRPVGDSPSLTLHPSRQEDHNVAEPSSASNYNEETEGSRQRIKLDNNARAV
ncbi:predicted protein [Uncinocarpus reesii 1704]|uniref:Uncharacterized protein n=1 Tax=Uncinocarpus reesii (strain UAMH 1704) TaxID=336963 RepID=C4JEV0_UNCRE|nr:uncharacterized protein UREG_02260 [Uncinocarpus reesii 1704]EEP77411.1 predicted protein [Uncinocarpus reesii 1704]